MRFFRKQFIFSAVAAWAFATPAISGDELLGAEPLSPELSAVEFRGAIGILALQGNELIYNAPGSTNLISHLIWQSQAPVLTGGLYVNLPDNWTLSAKAQVAMTGNSYMEDYDWFGPDFISYDTDDWTHRSQSDNTGLDWYFNGEVLVGRDFQVKDNVSVNMNGGLKYTDVQWSAVGGSYVYSDINVGDGCGFRGCIGDFADVPAITYRQQFPALIVGADTQIVSGNWTFDLAAHGGLTFSAKTKDNHWMRDLVILDALQMAPILSVAAQAEYEMSDNMSVFVGGTVEQIFAARADKQWWESGVLTAYSNSADSGGADLFAATLSGGLKGHF